ncbi:hypothetical protein [Enorma sp.]|uniref:hypothetical protein n=1 Tax=Enorma sp. TaxID=1920692 RepID=UPI003AB5742C
MPQHLRPNNASREESSHVARDSHGVQAPINAASAAHEAAHAHVRDLERLRREASGAAAPRRSRTSREGNGVPGGSERTRRVIIAASVFVGCALAAFVLFIGGRAVVDALLHDGASDDAVVAVDGASDGVSAQRRVARTAEQGSIATGGYVYSIEADDDAYVFAYCYEGHGTDPSPLFEVSGAPLGFVYFDGVFYIVSNEDNGFVVLSYVYGDGSLPVEFYRGEGTMVDLDLDDAGLVLTDAEARTYTLELPSVGE